MKEIPLTKGMVAQVSDEDYEALAQWKWTASLESRGTKWYAIRWSRKAEHGQGKRFKIRLHCVVMGRGHFPTDGLVVHHKDDDGLNCQRDNLAVITEEENRRLIANWKRKNPEPTL